MFMVFTSLNKKIGIIPSKKLIYKNNYAATINRSADKVINNGDLLYRYFQELLPLLSFIHFLVE